MAPSPCAAPEGLCFISGMCAILVEVRHGSIGTPPWGAPVRGAGGRGGRRWLWGREESKFGGRAAGQQLPTQEPDHRRDTDGGDGVAGPAVLERYDLRQPAERVRGRPVEGDRQAAQPRDGQVRRDALQRAGRRAEVPLRHRLQPGHHHHRPGEGGRLHLPYFNADQGVLARNGVTVSSVADAKKLRWGAQINTTGLDYIKGTIKPSSEAKVYQTTVDAFTALAARQIDAVMLDTPIVLGAVKAGQVKNGSVIAQFKTGEQYGAVVNKGSPNLQAFNQVITTLKSEGFLSTLLKKYFGGDPADVPFVSAWSRGLTVEQFFGTFF